MVRTDNLYRHPLWYARAFAWRHIDEEVRRLLVFARRHGRRPVRRVAECCCGPALHGAAFVAAGRSYVGMDQEAAMVQAARATLPGQVILRCNALACPLPWPVDLMCTMLGSLYVAGPADLEAHLHAAARAVAPGGCYLMEWCLVHGDPRALHDHWTVADEDWELEADYAATPQSDGCFSERLVVNVADSHGRRRLVAEQRQWPISEDHLRACCGAGTEWLYVGTWNRFDPDLPLRPGDEDQRTITVLRRR